MDEYRKAIWSLAFALAMFFDLTLLPVVWAVRGYNLQMSAIAVIVSIILAPLIAWRLVERFAGDEAGRYYTWELEALVKAGKLGMLWLNPVGWVWMLFIWAFVAAVKRWPGFGLFLCIILPNRK